VVLAGGVVRVEWGYPYPTLAKRPTGFHVYHGTGAVVVGSPSATVLYNGGTTYRAEVSGLSDGVSYWFIVRAYNATAEEPNETSITATANVAAPQAVDGFSIVASDSEAA